MFCSLCLALSFDRLVSYSPGIQDRYHLNCWNLLVLCANMLHILEEVFWPSPVWILCPPGLCTTVFWNSPFPIRLRIGFALSLLWNSQVLSSSFCLILWFQGFYLYVTSWESTQGRSVIWELTCMKMLLSCPSQLIDILAEQENSSLEIIFSQNLKDVFPLPFSFQCCFSEICLSFFILQMKKIFLPSWKFVALSLAATVLNLCELWTLVWIILFTMQGIQWAFNFENCVLWFWEMF